MGHRHLFGYGYFLNERLLRTFCPDAAFVTTAYYDSRRLAVDSHNQLTLRPRAGHRTYGVVWSIPDVELISLGMRLDVPRIYDRIGAFARTLEGSLCISEFLATRDQGVGVLSPRLLASILRSAKRWGFPASYLEEVCQWSTALEQRRAS